MSQLGYVPGLPGMRTPITATPRLIFKQIDIKTNLAAGKLIDGTKSRDSGNTGDLGVLRPGLLMGKITTGGLYAPAILGVTSGAYTSGGTTITVSAAQAVEINRRVGASGSSALNVVGPPTANGTVAVTACTHSAINTTTGVITITSLGVDKVAGSYVTAADGSQTPIAFISDDMPTGVLVLDSDLTTGITVPMPYLPVAGIVIASQLLPNWPTDTSLQTWLFTSLNTYGKFVPDYGY